MARVHIERSLKEPAIRSLSSRFPAVGTWLAMPAFVGWLAVSAGIACARFLPTSVHLLYHNCLTWAIVFCAACALFFGRLWLRALLLFAVGVLSWQRAATDETSFFSRLDTIATPAPACLLHGTVASVPFASSGRYTFVVRADSMSIGDTRVACGGRRLLCSAYSPPRRAARVICSGRYRAPRPAANPGAFDEYSYMLSSGLWGRFFADTAEAVGSADNAWFRATSLVRAVVMGALGHVQDDTHKAILQAAFLGEKHELTSSTKTAFRESGIYHLLAISGLHVAILISAVYFVLALPPIPRATKALLTIVVIWCYLFFVGFIPSLFRAVLMGTLVLLSFLFGRRNRALSALGLAGIAWLVLSPRSLFAPGYQLSFAATAGIITLFPVMTRHFSPSSRHPAHVLVTKPLLSLFFVSLSAFLATAPVLVHHFGALSLFGLFGNLFAVTLMSITMNLFFAGIAAQALWPQLSALAMRASEMTLAGIVWLAELGSHIPSSVITVARVPAEISVMYAVFLTGAALVAKKHFRAYVKWGVAALFVMVPASLLSRSVLARPDITTFHVEKGSLTGVRFPNAKAWLVGSAPQAGYNRPYRDAIGPWLRSKPFTAIDAVVLLESDPNVVHYLDPILEEHRVRNAIVCAPQRDPLLKEDFEELLAEYGVRTIVAHPGLSFVPCPRCTCTVENGFGLRVVLRDTTILISSGR